MKRSLTITFFFAVVISFIFFFIWLNNQKGYSFFVAGHIYGSPVVESNHIHPPFEAIIPYLNSSREMAFGVFTGDLVRKSEQVYFDTLMADLAELKMAWYVAPGNHDVGDWKLYRQYFGDHLNEDKTYHSFIKNNDLFIILDGNLNRESIVGDQLLFLKNNLEEYGSKCNNIFVFVHQLIWWSKDNEFKSIVTNWPPNTPDSNNFWLEVEPLLVASKKPVYIFAGDLGANHTATPIMYHHIKNISYIASGMGQNKKDNIVIVHVSKDGEVDLELVALQGKKNSLGKLEDYKLPVD